MLIASVLMLGSSSGQAQTTNRIRIRVRIRSGHRLAADHAVAAAGLERAIQMQSVPVGR